MTLFSKANINCVCISHLFCYFMCGVHNNAVISQSTQHQMVGLVNNKLEEIWKKAAAAYPGN